MDMFSTICLSAAASIMTTLYCWKKFGKEEEERILQEQKERREKIRDSMLQTGSKRYSFPIDLKKASDWPFSVDQNAGASVVWISAEKLSSMIVSRSICRAKELSSRALSI